MASALLKRAALIFWDFDGVIKESVSIKSSAFERLFMPYGAELADRVRRHHEDYGGVSRFEKMPIYLEWAGERVTPDRVQIFCERFSEEVRQAVIDSPWVPGVEGYLRANCLNQCFILVSATPQEEIEWIADALNLTPCFEKIYGAPMSKASVLREVLRNKACPPESALFVGDAEADFDAAAANRVLFLLRRTALNQGLQQRHRGPSFESLLD